MIRHVRHAPAWNSLLARRARADLGRNRGATVCIALVLVLCAFLMAAGGMVMERTLGAVDRLFEAAKPPHLLQMHAGELDRPALDRFAAAHPEIESWLVEEMVGYDGAALTWAGADGTAAGDFSDSLVDHLFVAQNESFDLLVDETGAAPTPEAGDVLVPVAIRERFDLRTGDVVGVRTDDGIRELRIAGFVRDAQMASSLSSATRFVVAQSDLDALTAAGGGAPESIVEYRLTDPAGAAALQRAYEADPSLPKNGQAVTYEMIRLINAISDGLVAVALVAVSLLLMVIALVSVRFVIRGTLEEQVREIGAMKAIGLPHRTISALYLSKYRLLTLGACIVGGALAVAATAALTRTLQENYLPAPVGVLTVAVPLVALGAVWLVVVGICRRVLGAIRRIEVTGALVHGSTRDERRSGRRAAAEARRARRTSLPAVPGGRGMNVQLALLELRSDRGQWMLLPIVFGLAAVLVTLPTTLLSTLEDPRFVTYMGAPESDVRADLRFDEDVAATRDDLVDAMRGDARLTDVRVFGEVLAEAAGPEGWQAFRVEVGDYSAGTVSYVRGDRPGDGEIALSTANADAYGVTPGDTLRLREGDVERDVVVSGVYQDVTSGGLTAKLQGDPPPESLGYVVYADTAPGIDAAGIASEYDTRFPGASVIPMADYVRQTLSYVTDGFRSASVLAVVFGVGVAALITGLFLRLRLHRGRRRTGVLQSIGFSIGEVVAQVRGQTVFAALVGTLLGVLAASTVGEGAVGLLIGAAGIGLDRLPLHPQPFVAYGLLPLLLVAAGGLVAVLLTASLRSTPPSDRLRA